MNINIGTLNLCLGLKNKKDEVKRLLSTNKLDILCLQETELESNYPTDILAFKGFAFEAENNRNKIRTGIYIKDNVGYTRRKDLEKEDFHIVIIELNDRKKTRIINIYRTFNPPMGFTQKTFFDEQISIINNASNSNTIIIGDLNLDYNKKHDVTYSHYNYFVAIEPIIEKFNLIQIVNFNTWSRVVLNQIKTSCLDHIYLNNPTSIKNLKYLTPPFGDHLLVSFTINSELQNPFISYRRNWQKYSKEALNAKLESQNWQILNDDVQGYWNCFESRLVQIVDELAPLELIAEKKHSRYNHP